MKYDLYQRKVSRSMRKTKRLSVSLEIKSIDESGRFAGYASVFDVVDQQRDVVQKGAFVQSLRNRVSEIKLLWQHDMAQPIGYFTEIFEDAYGLYVEGQLLLNVEKAREAFTLLKQGVVKGLSIGYAPIHYRMNPDDGVRELSQVELYEISLVTFPANAVAEVSVVKGSLTDIQNKEDTAMIALSAALDDMLQSLHG